jgi:hypothetical protein
LAGKIDVEVFSILNLSVAPTLLQCSNRRVFSSRQEKSDLAAANRQQQTAMDSNRLEIVMQQTNICIATDKIGNATDWGFVLGQNYCIATDNRLATDRLATDSNRLEIVMQQTNILYCNRQNRKCNRQTFCIETEILYCNRLAMDWQQTQNW